MASNFVKSNKMRRMETKKSHSWWWDSHISPKNSKWLQENLEDMDHHVKRMLKLIEEDADSFAKKAEMYYQKRPELISLVEDFYRMYRSLAERYDNVTGELRKNIPSDLQSQSSGISDVGSEPPSTLPSPDRRLGQRKSTHRAAGFDFFLGKSGEGDESSTLDSESESDDSSVNNYSGPHRHDEELQRKVIELEIELREVKDKLQIQDEKSGYGSFEVNAYEDELRVANEKIRFFEQETARLEIELHKYKSLDSGNHVNEIQTLEEKVASLNEELISKGSTIENLQDELKSAQKEVTLWKNKVEKEKREVSKLQDRMSRYKNNVSERDQEIRGLKEAISNANKSLSEENKELISEITRVLKEQAYMEDNLKEIDLRCQSLQEDVRRKAEMELILKESIDTLQLKYASEKNELKMKIEALDVEMSLKDDEIDEISKQLHKLHIEHVELNNLADELRARIKEVEREVEIKEEIIVRGAEEKREAIRQLCFSLEHYRNGYHRLREALMGNKRMLVSAS